MLDSLFAEKNLLVIDENPETEKVLSDFSGSKYVCDKAASPAEFSDKIQIRRYGVIIYNPNVLNFSQKEIILHLQSRSPDSLLIATGEKISAREAIEFFRAGVFDYLEQPLNLPEAERAIKRAFENYESKITESNRQTRLEKLIAERTAELDKAHEELENSYRLTLKALVEALETRDFETQGHSERAVTFSLRLGYELKLDKNSLRNLEFGALLHDVGKIGVSDAILQKPARLTDEERRKMKLHPVYGQQILRNIPFLADAERIVEQHHEKWDGTGYPRGLRGEDIDFGARIFAVADAFDAIISDKIYRRGRSYRAALQELQINAGTQFDPNVVEIFKKVPEEDWEILRKHSLTERHEIISFQSIVAELIHFRNLFETIH